MKTIYVKFKDLKAYHMYYWPLGDEWLFIEYKDTELKEYRITWSCEVSLQMKVTAFMRGEFLEIGEL